MLHFTKFLYKVGYVVGAQFAERISAINQSIDGQCVSSTGGCPYVYSRLQYNKFLLMHKLYAALACHYIKMSFLFFLGCLLPLLPSISAL